MAIDFTINQSPVDGSTLSFVDISSTFSGVLRTRFVFGSHAADLAQTVLVEGDPLEQYRQYQKTSLYASIYDNKTIPVAGMYIPFVTSLTVLPNDTFVETGRTSKYVSGATYLPTSSYNTFTRTPQDLLYASDVTVFPDGIYYLQYERYTNTIPSTITNVTAGSTYLVVGSATYNGNSYINGEVFVAGDNGPISFSRGNTAYILLDNKFKYFPCLFTVRKDYHNLLYRVFATCGCHDKLQDELYAIRCKIEFIEDSTIMDLTSATLCATILSNIQTELARLDGCIPQV